MKKPEEEQVVNHPGADTVAGLLGPGVTREDYIKFNWGGLDASEWDAEYEDALPKDLQDWSLFEADDTLGLKYVGPKIDTGYHGPPADEEEEPMETDADDAEVEATPDAP